MFPFRALRLKPLFLEEWGGEELVPFVAKRLKLSQVTFAPSEKLVTRWVL